MPEGVTTTSPEVVGVKWRPTEFLPKTSLFACVWAKGFQLEILYSCEGICWILNERWFTFTVTVNQSRGGGGPSMSACLIESKKDRTGQDIGVHTT